MTMAIRYFAGVFLLSASIPLHAESVAILGLGVQTCGSYLDSRQHGTSSATAFATYASGYLSAINESTPGVTNVLGPASDLAGAMYWLDNYCRGHPHDPFVSALSELVKRLLDEQQ